MHCNHKYHVVNVYKTIFFRKQLKMEGVEAAKVLNPIRQPKNTENAREKTLRARPHPERATVKGASRHETSHRPLLQRNPQSLEEKMRGKMCPKLLLKSPNLQSKIQR